MGKERIGGGRASRRHISEEEKKRNMIIYILVGILVAIFLLVLIIMIPKGDQEEQAPDAISRADSSMIDGTNTNTTSKSRVTRDPEKVTITVDTDTLTEEAGVITIVDTNDVPYTWTAIYRLQQYLNGKWQDMELKNSDNNILSDKEIDNPTGTMSQSLVWFNKYGALEPGVKYRIVKESEGTEFYAEFVIR